jgi:outer membrane immunogenic protein
MPRAIYTALAFAALSAGAAHAADLYVPAADQVITQSSDWTGFYVGASAGGGWMSALHGGDSDDRADMQGGVIGLEAGYNVQMDSLVLGIEGDIALGNILDGTDDHDHFEPEDGITALGTLRGRIGYAAGDLLLYGTAGLAVANLDTYDVSQTITGWVAGVGAEYKVTDAISLKAEYLYHDFGSEYVEGYGDNFDIHGSTAKVGLNFHF